MKLIDYIEKINEKVRNGENFEELETNFCKKCFELYDGVEGDKEELIKIAKQELVDYDLIKDKAYKYALYHLGFNHDKWLQTYVWNKKIKTNLETQKDILPTPRNLLFLKLMNEENDENIINLIENFDDKVDLKKYVFDFVIVYFPKQKNYLIDSLRKKIDLYLEHQKEQKKFKTIEKKLNSIPKEQEKYESSKFKIEEFINGNYPNKEQCCKAQKITIKEFDELVDLAKKYDLDTYQKYENKIDSIKKQNYVKLINTIKLMIDYINNGIKDEDDIIRTFDLIDYYLFINIDFDTIGNIIKDMKLSAQELKNLRTFIAKNKKNIQDRPDELKKILDPSSVQIISNRVIELEEKQSVISYLKEHHIAKNQVTYNMVLRRYLNGMSLDNRNNKNSFKK